MQIPSTAEILIVGVGRLTGPHRAPWGLIHLGREHTAHAPAKAVIRAAATARWGLQRDLETEMTTAQAFLDALVTSQRSPALAEADDIFGFLIGSWDLEAVLYDDEGRTQKSKGEYHGSWVLEGRAIQDLFIFPRRADRASGTPSQGDRYATTIRTCDDNLNAWRVNFINPAAEETSAQLVARRDGSNIEMEGTLADGTPIRWRYRSITPTSFHYSAERLKDETWHVYLELFGSRAASTFRR